MFYADMYRWASQSKTATSGWRVDGENRHVETSEQSVRCLMIRTDASKFLRYNLSLKIVHSEVVGRRLLG